MSAQPSEEGRSNQREGAGHTATLPNNRSALRPWRWSPALRGQLLGYWKGGEEGRSWLFSGVLGAGQAVEGIFGLLWLVPLIGFAAVA